VRLRRIFEELRRAPPAKAGDEAIASLRFRRDEDGAIAIARGEGEPLDRLGPSAADVVRIGEGIYRTIPGARARVRLLEIAREASRERVVVHVPITDEGTHPARAFIDAPRALLRRLGAAAPEPGDRFGPDGYAHLFFDEEALEREIAAARLAVVGRRGFTFELGRAEARAQGDARGEADAFAAELLRVAGALREAERARLRETPERALASMRARGRDRPRRTAVGRARLRRAIGWIDAVAPGGASCYRRTLLELALDGGAAREPVVFGLDVGRTGHVAFKDREDRTFDVAFEVGPLDGP
jgi:hypothetical protein